MASKAEYELFNQILDLEEAYLAERATATFGTGIDQRYKAEQRAKRIKVQSRDMLDGLTLDQFVAFGQFRSFYYGSFSK